MKSIALGAKQVRWTRVVFAVFAVLFIALVAPHGYYIHASPLPIVLCAASVAYFYRLRPIDGAIWLCAGLLAELFSEPLIGPMLLMACSLVLMVITCRPTFAVVTASVGLAILVVAVEMKRRHAGSPLTWQDVTYFFSELRDNAGVMASQPTILLCTTAAVTFASACLWLAWRHDSSVNAAPRSGSTTRAARLRPRLMLVAAALLSIGAFEFVNNSSKGGLRTAWMFSEASASTPISSFLATRRLSPVATSDKVDTSAFSALVEQRAAASRRESVATPADIVVFLQESQFNPLAVAGCPIELCTREVDAFVPSKSTTDSGQLRVHVFGGGTWLTEFAFATGVPHDLYGKAGDYAPFNVAPKVGGSFIRSLKKAGYQTVAIYPVRGGMMNARAAYRAYGFDEFLDSDDLGIDGRFDVSDQTMYDAALKVLRDREVNHKPLFLMVVTIFNHSQHGVRMERVPGKFALRAAGFHGAEADRLSLVDYVWRTEEFSRVYERTRHTLLARDRRSVVAWFGDHQPPFGTAPGLLSRIHKSERGARVPSRNITWYRVDSNFGAPTVPMNADMQDIVFLPGLIAERAGVPLDEWLSANVLAREKCAGLYVECADSTARLQYTSYLLDRIGALPR